jgi:hypothetical protein
MCPHGFPYAAAVVALFYTPRCLPSTWLCLRSIGSHEHPVWRSCAEECDGVHYWHGVSPVRNAGSSVSYAVTTFEITHKDCSDCLCYIFFKLCCRQRVIMLASYSTLHYISSLESFMFLCSDWMGPTKYSFNRDESDTGLTGLLLEFNEWLCIFSRFAYHTHSRTSAHIH